MALTMISSGAHPGSTFPNNHLVGAPCSHAVWSAPQASSPVAALREQVEATDWEELFAARRTKLRAVAAWSSGSERCQLLQALCAVSNARRVLEVGAFCGVASLSMAEAIPEDGELVALELDPFLVDFGVKARATSAAGSKISHLVGPAADSLAALARQAAGGEIQPFDLVLIDADKSGMAEYVRCLWDSPGLLSWDATLCVDITPFKGQLPYRYMKYGQVDRWVVPSGQLEIDAFRASLKNSEDLAVHETGRLLIIRRRLQ